MDTDQFRKDLKAWEANLTGGSYLLKTHLHNTEVTVAGTTFARAVEIIAPYSVEFEDGQYTIILEGSNNNIFDVASGILVQNQVQVIPTNSAGLIKDDAQTVIKLLTNKNSLNQTTGVLVIFEDDDVTPFKTIQTYSDDAHSVPYDGTLGVHSQDKAT
jgi:hypothetical protein